VVEVFIGAVGTKKIWQRAERGSKNNQARQSERHWGGENALTLKLKKQKTMPQPRLAR
jgi:hypothetical protein